jgi:hypothetical protein
MAPKEMTERADLSLLPTDPLTGTYFVANTNNIQCDKSIFEKKFLWFLGQPVVWSEPNISQIEAWSSTIYARY